MRVEKVRIQNFLSIRDSGEINFDDKLTCFIGKNETGKTNLLKALRSFDTDYEYSEEDLCSYCEAKEELDRGDVEPEDIEMVTIWFRLEREDKEKLKKLNRKFGNIRVLEVTEYYNNGYEIKIPEVEIKDLVVETDDIIKKLKSEIDNLTHKLNGHAKRHKPFLLGITEYKNYVKEFRSTEFTSDNVDSTFTDFLNEIRDLSGRDDEIDSDLVGSNSVLIDIRNELRERLQIDIEDEILSLIPRLVYYDDIERLVDTVKINDFVANKEEYKALADLMTLSGLNVENIIDKTKLQRRIATEEASTKITGLLNKSWNQETVTVKIGIDGEDIIVFVEDKVGAYNPPSKRSQGFQWFLSFYIKFTAGSKGELKNTILLLDDPGVYLHPSGQKDLLKTLEKLAKDNQFIYTTHSPFLIDKENIDRIRIVEKVEDRVGTIIKEKFHDSDFDAFEPIRAAIGATIGDSLFGSRKNIVVEGYSDYLILEGMSRYFERNGKESLNLSEVAIIPSGGAKKVPYFTLILWKENYRFIIVLDNDTQGRKITGELKSKYPIDENLVINIDEVAPDELQGRDITIEDFIDASFYNKAVNDAYKDIIREKIKLDDLDTSITMQTKRYKLFFNKDRMGKFDKILVAKQINNLASDKSCNDTILGETTIRNFEELFKTINEKLK